jgi:PAT family beta-lactamase induction signal transducer AmpG
VGTRRKLWWVGLLYFAEGLPYGLVVDNFPVYFRLHGVSLGALGLMSLLTAPWSAKVLWAPLVDQLGERRQWMAGALAVMAAALLVLPALPPAPVGAALVAVLLVFTTAAATQDVAIDAYTIELLVPGEEGIANGVRVSTYRAALVAGGGVLVALAARAGWAWAYALGAAAFAALALVAWHAPSVPHRPQPPAAWARALRAWLTRRGGPAVFAFVLLYKLGERALGPMVKPFWVDRGLSLGEIALVSTTLGVAASVAGALLGGAYTSRRGIFRGLWVLGLVQAASHFGYATAAWTGAGRQAIYAASLLESFCAGLGTAAFLAFLMNICEKRQAATQYALLSALFNLGGTTVGALSGVGATQLGYGTYFAFTALLALPAFALLPWVRRWIVEPVSRPSP